MQSLKILGALLDEACRGTSTSHIMKTRTPRVSVFYILYKAKQFLNKKSMECLYYSYIHTYLNYANLAWRSTNKTKLNKRMIQQKEPLRIINNKPHFCHTKELFPVANRILHIFEINIFNASVLVLIHKIYCQTALGIFELGFENISCKYQQIFLN